MQQQIALRHQYNLRSPPFENQVTEDNKRGVGQRLVVTRITPLT